VANPPLTQILFDTIQRDFFDRKGKKIGKFDTFKGNFLNPRWLTRTEQQKTNPGPSLCS